jgi:hypothetical protein
MSATVLPHADQDAALAALAARLVAVPRLLLPLDMLGCNGTDCPVPAFRDRGTGAWRHLGDLSRCHADRPLVPGAPTVDAGAAGEHP